MWSNGETTTGISGLTAGTYYLTVSDSHSCTIPGGIWGQEPDFDLTAAAAESKPVTCFHGDDGQATVTPDGGWGSYTFLWNNGQTSFTATGLTAGTYSVTVSDGGGCSFSTSTVVNEPGAALAASAAETKPVTCFGGSDGTAAVYASDGWGSYTYLWNNSQTGATASGLSAGIYSVTVSDLNGCSVTANATVTGPSGTLAATAAETKVVTCFGGADGTATVYPSLGWGSYSYTWNNTQTGATASGLSAGTYTVTVADFNGCTVTATATVTGPSGTLAASAAETKVVTCFGATDGQATVYPSSGWGSYTYLWNNTQTGAIATSLTAGLYTVTVSDLHGCNVTASASVTGPSASLAATAVQTKPVSCFNGSNGEAAVYPSNGWGIYTYTWNNSQTGATAMTLTAGIYTVTVTDQHSCAVTATASVSGPIASLAASAAETKPVSCFGESNGTAAVYPSDGWGSYTYTWNNTQTGATATGLSAGTYTVTVSDAEGCTSTATAYVSQPAASLTSTYSNTNVLGCHGDHTGAINLTATGGTSPYYYAWTGTGVAATAEDQTGLAAGTYNLTITDARSCTTSTSAVISQPDQLTSNPLYTDVLCNGNTSGAIDPQISGGTPGYAYTWDDFNLSSDPILTGVTAGTYHVTVTDNNTCVLVVGPLTITEPELFDALNTAHNVSCKGASDGHIDQNYISGGVSPYYYTWSNGATTTGLLPQHNPNPSPVSMVATAKLLLHLMADGAATATCGITARPVQLQRV